MPFKKTIDDEKLLSMIKEMPQKEIARHFGVSPSAVCKQLKRLLPAPETILDKYDLTKKEKAFIKAKAAGATNTQAAMNAYETTSMESAKSLGSALMNKPEIKESIQDIMENEGLTRTYRVVKLKKHVDNRDPNISLKGLDMSFKLDGSYAPEKHEVASINLNIESSDARYRAFIGLHANIPERRGAIDIADEPSSEN
jgi:DNA-binding Lrp family transcriptional regulator